MLLCGVSKRGSNRMSDILTVYLGLGSNMGKRAENIGYGLRLLSESVQLDCVSSIYETEPMEYRKQDPFLNLVCKAKTNLSPKRLLLRVKNVEENVGRVPTFRYGPRVLDIDVLLYGDQVIDTTELTVPHPRMTERAFVLVPLLEIAPDLLHPRQRLKFMDFLEVLSDIRGVRLVEPPMDIAGLGSAMAI